MGASPFSIDDPRYANWISIGLLVAEDDARIQAELLHHAATVTPERRSALIIEGVVRHFDLRACILSLVKNYDDAMLCLQWLNAAAPEIARRLREQARGTQLTSETFFQLDLRLKQRLRYWTAEALRGAREGEKRRSEPARLAAVEGAAVALERPRPVEDDVRAEERLASTPSDTAVVETAHDALAGSLNPATVQEQNNEVRPETDRGAVVQAVFKRRNRRHWLVVYGDERSDTVRDVKGMRWISHLLASPRQAMSAQSVLVDSTDQSPAAGMAREVVADALNSKNLSSETDTIGRVSLTAEGKRSYMAQMKAIQEKIDDLDPFAQPDRIAELRDEQMAIAEEIRKAKGEKNPTSHRERARKAAAGQYDSVLNTLENADLLKLVAHIRSSIRPGHEFEYTPQTPISWEIG